MLGNMAALANSLPQLPNDAIGLDLLPSLDESLELKPLGRSGTVQLEPAWDCSLVEHGLGVVDVAPLLLDRPLPARDPLVDGPKAHPMRPRPPLLRQLLLDLGRVAQPPHHTITYTVKHLVGEIPTRLEHSHSLRERDFVFFFSVVELRMGRILSVLATRHHGKSYHHLSETNKSVEFHGHSAWCTGLITQYRLRTTPTCLKGEERVTLVTNCQGSEFFKWTGNQAMEIGASVWLPFDLIRVRAAK